MCQILSYTPDERVHVYSFHNEARGLGLASPGAIVATARPTGGYSGASTTVMPRKNRLTAYTTEGLLGAVGSRKGI